MYCSIQLTDRNKNPMSTPTQTADYLVLGLSLVDSQFLSVTVIGCCLYNYEHICRYYNEKSEQERTFIQ